MADPNRFKARKLVDNQDATHTNRFTSREMANTRDEDVITPILSGARNWRMTQVKYPSISTFVPNATTLLYYLNRMDLLMTSTKEWTDNCMGWVPPLSQIYISVLFYVQTMRAMNVARALFGSGVSAFLEDFERMYPFRSLVIPGPLVPFFKNLSCFIPNATTQPGRYGYTTPALPQRPGWSENSEFSFGVDVVSHLPNISIFISRLRSICSIAMKPDMNESLFQEDVNGPCFMSTLFGRECTHSEYEIHNLTSPGSNLMYSGSLRLWKKAALYLERSCIPEELIGGKHNVKNSWYSALRFDSEQNWFGNLSEVMISYSKYWKGSAFLDSCPPNNSAAGAVVCYATSGDIFRSPKWNEPTRTNENKAAKKGHAHYSLRHDCTMTFDAKTAHEELSQEAELAAITYHFNLIPDKFTGASPLSGSFWKIRPNVAASSHIPAYGGVFSTIGRNYHWDTPIPFCPDEYD